VIDSHAIMSDDDATAGEGPLTGIRVLECSTGMAARVAGMLLAELGADVVRVVDGPVDGDDSPEGLCWDRGKLIASAGDGLVDAVVEAAHAVLADRPLPAGCRGRVVVTLPAYEAEGPYSGLAGDPLLLAGLGGIAAHHPASADVPVFPVVPTTGYIHGGLGAVAVVAALLEQRRTGAVRAATVSGLHACAAQMATIMLRGLDVEVTRPGRALRAGPNFRMYRAAGDEWFFLAALTPDLFVAALTALGCPELLLCPGIDGDPMNILVRERNRELTRQLEEKFLAGRRPDWLARLAAGGIPCAPVQSRPEWMDGEVLSGNAGLVQRNHPGRGPVRLPDIPIRFSETAGSSRPFARTAPGAAAVWPGAEAVRPAVEASPGRRPLAGVRVVDMASFLAAPLAASILADMGAEVVRIESPSGDPYRVFSLSYLAVNQRKRHAAIDLRRADGAEAARALISGADVVIENRGEHGLAKLGLPARLTEINPAVVHCAVSAFGQAPGMSEMPGFDPVFQALSGMAVAQGGSGEPVTTTMPVHDTAVGVLGALGVVAALLARERLGRGQHVGVSLAMANTFLQSAELTSFDSRPRCPVGGPDFPGPGVAHRFYRCRDGWVGVAAGEGRTGDLTAALGIDPEAPNGSISASFALLAVTDALAVLQAADVPAAPVLDEGDLQAAHLQRNRIFHIIEDPQFGRVEIVRSFCDWTPDGPPQPARSVPVGADTEGVLAELP
jgi:crotonobetainyl-CoA:carnitine CoA-transferase CaiB-like acyl-CoA transferase